MQIVGTRGFKGKKAMNARTQFSALFDVADNDSIDDQVEQEDLDSCRLDQLATLA
jgi:hypothetical protein